MLELRRVSKCYSGIPAVADISFAARPGEVTGYLGPNRSGKYACMMVIVGIVAYGLWAWNRHRSKSAILYFEELPAEVILTLGLT